MFENQEKDRIIDLVIIGAGIAGLSAAYAACKQHSKISIALIESVEIGANNPSPLTFYDTVHKFNLHKSCIAHYNNFTYYNPGGSSVTFRFSDTPLVVLSYKAACQSIFSNIVECLSYNPLHIKKVVEVISKTDSVTTYCNDGCSFKSRLLIDCSGKAQIVASKLNPTHNNQYSVVYGAKFQDIDTDKFSPAYLMPSKSFGTGGGWFYPVENKCVSFGYASIENKIPSDFSRYLEFFTNALSRCYPYSTILQSRPICHSENGIIPISYHPKILYNNIMIAGDAAGMATSWTCMGVEPALQYGEIAGRCSANAILNGKKELLQELQLTWNKNDLNRRKQFAKLAKQFWSNDFHFWEWIVRNDLRHLNSKKALERMRYNKRIINSVTALRRTLIQSIKQRIFKKFKEPQQFYCK